MPQRANSILAVGLMLVVACFAKPADAGINISVDWDATMIGIQSTIAANPGDIITANIIFEITGASSIRNYEMSTRFSSSRLTFLDFTEIDRFPESNRRIDMGPVNLPSRANDPTSNIQNTGFTTPVLGEYGTNNQIAGSIDPPAFGPTSADSAFSVAAVRFRVNPGADGVVLIPGIFPNGFDGFVNNAQVAIPDGSQPPFVSEITFFSGSITAVPEPSAVALFSFALVAVGVRTYRNRRNLVA